MTLVCVLCSEKVSIPERVGFRDVCPSCNAYLHSCVNCRFYVNENCIESQAEKVKDPEGQNYCEWFKPREGQQRDAGQVKGQSGRSEAEEMWRKLTGKD
jgi:hypothetical protein